MIRTPLAVSSASSCSSQPSEGSSSLSEAALGINYQDVPVFSSDEFQQSAAHRRSYSSVLNWEKIREKLLLTAMALFRNTKRNVKNKCMSCFKFITG